MLLAIALLGAAVLGVESGSVHPASLALLPAYGFGLELVGEARSQPMWGPRQTAET